MRMFIEIQEIQGRFLTTITEEGSGNVLLTRKSKKAPVITRKPLVATAPAEPEPDPEPTKPPPNPAEDEAEDPAKGAAEPAEEPTAGEPGEAPTVASGAPGSSSEPPASPST